MSKIWECAFRGNRLIEWRSNKTADHLWWWNGYFKNVQNTSTKSFKISEKAHNDKFSWKHSDSFYFFKMRFTGDCSYESSSPDVFCKKDVLKNLAKFTGKHMCHTLFLIKMQVLAVDSSTDVFLWIWWNFLEQHFL